MLTSAIKSTTKIADILEQYPQAIDFFQLKGFPIENKQFGKALEVLTLQSALSIKNIDLKQFIQELEAYTLLHQEYNEQVGINAENDQIQQISGSLPCVVQLPLQTELKKYLSSKNIHLTYHFQSASQGTYDLPTGKNKPAIYMGAGFIPFLTQQFNANYMQHPARCPNPYHFSKPEMQQFKDPDDRFHIISVIPMVMVINHSIIEKKHAPTSWKDLTNPAYKNNIAYPNEDKDLKNILLAYFYKLGGKEAVRAFAKNCMVELHPSQMIKSKRLENKPGIMIMPHFFANLANREKEFEIVWPQEGAFCIPLILIADNKMTPDEKTAYDFFFSKPCGDIFQNQGYFPSTHQDVSNDLPGSLTWTGWEFIREHNMPEIMNTCEHIFEKERAI